MGREGRRERGERGKAGEVNRERGEKGRQRIASGAARVHVGHRRIATRNVQQSNVGRRCHTSHSHTLLAHILNTTVLRRPLASFRLASPHPQSRQVLRQVSTKLITAWRDSHTAASANGSSTNSTSGSSSSTGVAPGSFLGLMLAARDRSRKEGGAAATAKDGAAATAKDAAAADGSAAAAAATMAPTLTDAQIEAQVQTFLLAGEPGPWG